MNAPETPEPDPTPRWRLLTRIAFWGACAFAFVMAVIPRPPDVLVSDKVQHVVAFLVLAILGHAAYPNTKKRYLLVGLAGFGALIEFVQGLVFIGRDEDALDWVADTGAALAVFIAIAIWTWRRRGRP